MPDAREILQRSFEESGGAMPFEAFMALALYDPELGYYARHVSDVGGSRADFATAATLTGALGQGIARWIEEERRHHRWGGPLHLVEVGGGDGSLAATVLRSLGWFGRRGLRYHLVEVSDPLRARQRERLRRRRVEWHGRVEDALAAAGGRALVFSNELVDAFPAKWLRYDASAGTWREIWVEYHPGAGLRERLRPLEPPLSPEDCSALALPGAAEGQRIEVQPAYRDWLRGLAGAWREGSLLTIDYGGTPAEIYRRRPGGSLRAYWRHQRLEGGEVYRRVGRQDLTVDVNFDDLRRWGEAMGFETVASESQREFLRRYGSGTDPMAHSAAGEAFRVLWQRREAVAEPGRNFSGDGETADRTVAAGD